MAQEILMSFIAQARLSLLSGCALALSCTAALSQEPPRPDCMTRLVNGVPVVTCREPEASIIRRPPPLPGLPPTASERPPVITTPQRFDRSMHSVPSDSGVDRGGGGSSPAPSVAREHPGFAPPPAPVGAAPSPSIARDHPSFAPPPPAAANGHPAAAREMTAPPPSVGGNAQPAGAARNGAARDHAAPPAVTTAVTGGARSLRPVRALIEPAEMPPREVAGYGLVAFTAHPLSDDLERYKAVCEAYKATLISQDELPSNTPLSEQMVTYWPITDKSAPEALRVDCAHLVTHYALRLGLDAIQDADKRGEGMARHRGPYLIAWAPSESRFKPDAVVLVMDLSSLDDQRSFVEVFQQWRQEITDKPELWHRGFDVEAVRRTIRDTFDRYGDGLLRLIKAQT